MATVLSVTLRLWPSTVESEQQQRWWWWLGQWWSLGPPWEIWVASSSAQLTCCWPAPGRARPPVSAQRAHFSGAVRHAIQSAHGAAHANPTPPPQGGTEMPGVAFVCLASPPPVQLCRPEEEKIWKVLAGQEGGWRG